MRNPILATANTVFLRRGRAYTNTPGREIKSPIQLMDFEQMTYRKASSRGAYGHDPF